MVLVLVMSKTISMNYDEYKAEIYEAHQAGIGEASEAFWKVLKKLCDNHTLEARAIMVEHFHERADELMRLLGIVSGEPSLVHAWLKDVK